MGCGLAKMRGNYRKLGRKTSHRIAMLRTMVNQLVQSQRIRTTLAKAKEVKPLADKIVTLGKRGTLEANGVEADTKIHVVLLADFDQVRARARILRASSVAV